MRARWLLLPLDLLVWLLMCLALVVIVVVIVVVVGAAAVALRVVELAGRLRGRHPG